ncbi:MAG: hypothetical protein ACXW0R_14330, partial [Gaiellaceae bacterium]
MRVRLYCVRRCARQRRPGTNVVLLVSLLLVLLLVATVTRTAEARPQDSEADLRSLETRLLGPEHAAEHAAQRRWQRLTRGRRPAQDTHALRAPAVGPPAE